MGDSVLDLTDKLWRGEVTVGEVHPVTSTRDLEEVAPGIAFIPAFGNVSAFATPDAAGPRGHRPAAAGGEEP